MRRSAPPCVARTSLDYYTHLTSQQHAAKCTTSMATQNQSLPAHTLVDPLASSEKLVMSWSLNFEVATHTPIP